MALVQAYLVCVVTPPSVVRAREVIAAAAAAGGVAAGAGQISGLGPAPGFKEMGNSGTLTDNNSGGGGGGDSGDDGGGGDGGGGGANADSDNDFDEGSTAMWLPAHLSESAKAHSRSPAMCEKYRVLARKEMRRVKALGSSYKVPLLMPLSLSVGLESNTTLSLSLSLPLSLRSP